MRRYGVYHTCMHGKLLEDTALDIRHSRVTRHIPTLRHGFTAGVNS